MQHDPFFQFPRESRATPAGAVELPIFYFDTTAVLAFFRADAAAARALLPPGLELAVEWGGNTIAGLALYEYRDTSVGGYNEVGLALPVYQSGNGRPRRRWQDLFARSDERALGFHILDLPVTTELANAAGRGLWNFPKFVTRIPFRLTTGRLDCEVRAPNGGGAIMTLAGATRALLPLPSVDLVLYSELEGQWLRTLVNTRGGMRLHVPGTVRLAVGAASHPMAQRLRDLGLDGARPLALLSSTEFQSRLNAGAVVGGAGQGPAVAKARPARKKAGPVQAKIPERSASATVAPAEKAGGRKDSGDASKAKDGQKPRLRVVRDRV
ncbi:MAG: acetoacetate decarboxylase family protein [Pseudomonadota bacterium]